jgi:hypothetical protein
MRWAELVLNYLQALAWPGVAAAAIWIFRDQVRTLILSARKISAFGAEAEFEKIEEKVRQAEAQVDSLVDSRDTSPKALASPEGKSRADVLRSLSSVDFSDLVASDPVSASAEVVRRLDGAVARILDYLGVPPSLDVATKSEFMAEITDDQRWLGFLRAVGNLSDAAAEIKDLASDMQWNRIVNSGGRLDKSARELINATYEITVLFRNLVEIAIDRNGM